MSSIIPSFRAGEVTTSFLDDSPELFRFTSRADRATKLLSYVGDVILNGNPEVKGKQAPESFEKAVLPRVPGIEPPDGSRQLLQKLGPKKFAAWARKEKRLLLTDTTFRDAHQSLMATRVAPTTCSPLPMPLRNVFPIFSAWKCGAARPSTLPCASYTKIPGSDCANFANVFPISAFRCCCVEPMPSATPPIPTMSFSILCVNPPNKASTSSASSIRSTLSRTCAFPSTPSSKPAPSANLPSATPATSLTNRARNIRLKYYVQMAKQLEKLGAHFLAIKDMAGLCKPYAAFTLVKALREEIGIPIHFHTHDTSGINTASLLKAAEAGVDVADAAIASMSGGTSQPNLNSAVEALRHTPRDTQLDMAALNECSDYWETVRTYYLPFDSGPKSGSARLYEHEIPGGQFTNLREQAASMGLGHRWREVEKTYAEVNQLFGDIVKVTPSSKVVGDMTLFLLANEMKPADLLQLDEHHDISLPNSVVEMFSGALGVPPGGWPKKLQRIILARPGAAEGQTQRQPRPVDWDQERAQLEKKTGHPVSRDALLSYLLYPEVFLKYDKFRQTYSDVSVLPTPAFFYGLKPAEEITVEIESGKTMIVKFLTDWRSSSRWHAHALLRTERPAPRSHCSRSRSACRRAQPSQGQSRRSGPRRRAHCWTCQQHRRSGESSRRTGC